MKKCKLFLCENQLETYIKTFNSFDETFNFVINKLNKNKTPMFDIETYTKNNITTISYGSKKYHYKVKRFTPRRKRYIRKGESIWE